MTDEETEGQLLDSAIRNALYESLREVWRRYEDVVRERTHEVTIMAEVAAELQPRIDAALAHRYRVDVEYNRWHGPKARYLRAKYLPCAEGNRKLVRPDLIVHDRTGDRRHNLLVVEAKQGARVRPEKRKCDYDKLRGFQSVYGYRQAVYVEFDGRGGLPHLAWIRPGHPSPNPAYRPAEAVSLS